MPRTNDGQYDFARIDSYAGVWAIDETRGRLLQQTIESTDILEHLRQQVARREAVKQAAGNGMTMDRYGYDVQDGIAVFSIEGTMMKQASSFGGTSTAMMRRDIREAKNDPEVKGAVIVFDTPGGSAAGTSDLAEDVAAFAAVKPIIGYCQDCCASAGYWVASQCTALYANAGAVVGSIGSYMVVRDSSVAAAQSGIKTYVVRKGEFKGAGTPGTEISPEVLAELQRVVDAATAPFLRQLADGRELDPDEVEQLADGRIHAADDAEELGLIDGIKTLDEVMAELAAQLKPNSRAGGRSAPASNTAVKPAPTSAHRPKGLKMDNETTNTAATDTGAGTDNGGTTASTTTETTKATPKPATLGELRAAFPGDAEFVIEQAEKGATLDQAKREHDFLQRRLKTAAQNTERVTVAPGNKKPLAMGTDNGGKTQAQTDNSDPIVAWNSRVADLVKGGKTQAQAIRSLIRDEPELHQEYVVAYSDKHLPKRPARAF